MLYEQTEFCLPPTPPQPHTQYTQQLELLEPQSPPESIPTSPMIVNSSLGAPNRSCQSCKRRKVKCDRRTPACNACVKSKLRCFYTSYSPPAYVEPAPVQDEDENVRHLRQRLEQVEEIGRQRWDRIQKLVAELRALQSAKDDRTASPNYQPLNDSYPIIGDDEYGMLRLNVENPSSLSQESVSENNSMAMRRATTTTTAHHHHSRYSPYPNPYAVSADKLKPASMNAAASAGNAGDFVPIMKATVTFNFNAMGLRHILNRSLAPMLEAMTSGPGPQFPSAGFNDITQLYAWLRDKFIALYNEDSTVGGMVDPTYEQWDLRSIDEGNTTLSQQFEIVMLCKTAALQNPQIQHHQHHHHHQHPSPVLSSASDDMYSDTSSETMSNSGVIEEPTADAFLNSVYSFVRSHIRQLQWLREGFAVFAMATLEGVVQDVIVQVQDTRSGDDLPKGRFFF